MSAGDSGTTYLAAEARLRDGELLLLDGGIGSEVLRAHIASDVNLWAVGPLLNAPELLLLDEPTAHLDLRHRIQVLSTREGLLHRLRRHSAVSGL